MKKNNKPLRRTAAILLSLLLALSMLIPAFAAGGNTATALSLGENNVILGTVYANSYYTFTPDEDGDYIIRSVSSAPSDPYMEYNFTSYLDHDGSADFYCSIAMTAGTTYNFNIHDVIDDSAVVIVVEKAAAVLPNALFLGDNALSLNRKNYAEEYSFTPSENGVYEFSSSGYGMPGCVWGDDDYGAEGLVGDTYSWQFRFEKELTGGTAYFFKPYNQSGAYEGTVTITKLEAATVEIDELTVSFGETPALLVGIGDAAVTVEADAHCSVEFTWSDHNGKEQTDGDVFRCGYYYLQATITPDSGYRFTYDTEVTFSELSGAATHSVIATPANVLIEAGFDFGRSHSYTAWEEMSDIQINEAGFGAPYEGCVWEYRTCTDCEKTQYRGGDSPLICSVNIAFSNAPSADLTANDVTVSVPAGRPYYLVPAVAGADPAYPEWTGTFGNTGDVRFLCGEEYQAAAYLYPTAGHEFSGDHDLEILLNGIPASAIDSLGYYVMSDGDGIIVYVNFNALDHIYSGPVWSWKEDYTEAYAVFSCQYCEWEVTGTSHNPPMSIVSDATYTADQVIQYTATVLFRGITYTNTTDPISVDGTAAALLAADTATFNSYKAEKAAALDDLAQNGDSAASSALIADAKATITNLAFDTEKSLEDNKTAVDTAAVSVTEQLAADLQAQRAAEALAADKAAFEEYKAAKAAELDTLAEEGDSAASQALISAAKAEIAALAYDESKTLEENKGAADTGAAAIAAQLSADLQTQRAADQAAQEEQPDEPQENPQQQESGFRRFLNRIRDFFHRIAEFFRNLFKR